MIRTDSESRYPGLAPRYRPEVRGRRNWANWLPRSARVGRHLRRCRRRL